MSRPNLPFCLAWIALVISTNLHAQSGLSWFGTLVKDESLQLLSGPNPTHVYALATGNSAAVTCGVFDGPHTTRPSLWCNPQHTKWTLTYQPAASEDLLKSGVWPGPAHLHLAVTGVSGDPLAPFTAVHRLRYDGSEIGRPIAVGETLSIKVADTLRNFAPPGSLFSGKVLNLSVPADSPDGSMEFVVARLDVGGTITDTLLRIDQAGYVSLGNLTLRGIDVSGFYREGTPNRRLLVTEDNVVVLVGDKIWMFSGDAATKFIYTGVPEMPATSGLPDSYLSTIFGNTPISFASHWAELMQKPTWTFLPIPNLNSSYYPAQAPYAGSANRKGIVLTYSAPAATGSGTEPRVTEFRMPAIELPKFLYPIVPGQTLSPSQGPARFNSVFGLMGTPIITPGIMPSIHIDQFHDGFGQGLPPFTPTIPATPLPMPGGEIATSFSTQYVAEEPCSGMIFTTANGSISKQYGIHFPFINGAITVDALSRMHVPAACATPPDNFDLIAEIDFAHDYNGTVQGKEALFLIPALTPGNHIVRLCLIDRSGFTSWRGLTCSQGVTQTPGKTPPTIDKASAFIDPVKALRTVEIDGQNLAPPSGGSLSVKLADGTPLTLTSVSSQQLLGSIPKSVLSGANSVTLSISWPDGTVFNVGPAPVTVPALTSHSIVSVTELGSSSAVVAPGSPMMIRGADLCSDVTFATTDLPWPTSTPACSITIDGEPVPFGSWSQLPDATYIFAQLPYDVAPGTRNIVISRANADGTLDFTTDPFAVQVAPAAPVISDVRFSPSNRAVTADAPIQPGSTLWLSGYGLGVANPPQSAGTAIVSPPAALAAEIHAWLKVQVMGDWTYVELPVTAAIYLPSIPYMAQVSVSVPSDIVGDPGGAFVVIKCGDAYSDEKPVFFGGN